VNQISCPQETPYRFYLVRFCSRLVTQLIPLLITRGVTVSTVKHAHHAFDVGKPGKDSFEHRSAGATKFQPNDTAAGAVEPVRLIY
jgi:hypothetical protein